MNGNETCVFAFGHLRNADGEPSHSARVFMEERARRIAQDQKHDHALNEAILATEEESALKTKLLTHLLERLGGSADYERLRALKKDRLERVKKLLSAFPVLDSPGTPGGPFSNPDPDSVQVWWANTTWWYPAGESTMWMDGTGVHVAAHFESDDGDLHSYSIRVLAHFEISAERMPAKGRAYLSNPAFEVSGHAFGFTAQSGLYDFGDSWSKCWLNIRQTVFMFTDPGPPTPGVLQLLVGQPLGTATDSRAVVFTEDGSAVHANFPGLMGLPLSFFLPETARSLLFEMEWRFDVQIEDGLLYLGHRPDGPVCTIQHPQWPIRPV
jgi:hypothetical protein